MAAVRRRAPDVVDRACGRSGMRTELGRSSLRAAAAPGPPSRGPPRQMPLPRGHARRSAPPTRGRGAPRGPALSSCSETLAMAITIALRVPTLANDPGPSTTGHSTPTISSSSASAVRFGPSRNSFQRRRRSPRTEASRTSPPYVASTGRKSPAGEAVARFPPIVARLRIWGIRPSGRLEPAVETRRGRPRSARMSRRLRCGGRRPAAPRSRARRRPRGRAANRAGVVRS